MNKTAKNRTDKIRVPELIRTKWGFYQYRPLPGDEELRHYYERKYYQEARGSYELSYTRDEIRQFRLKASLVFRKSAQIAGRLAGKKLIDIGCGEGWIMNEFHRRKCSVLGLDFSRYGLEKFHPHLIPNLEQGDIYDLLQSKVTEGEPFDILVCANVIEHVKDPVMLIRSLKKIAHKGSLVIIIAPNDFSPLHEHLWKTKKISRQFWLSYPDHLSYFNKASMVSFLSDMGFDVRAVVADNPIDLNLLNDNSNYVEDQEKGKKTHLFRVRCDNFLGKIDPGKLLELYEVLGSMGVGRDLNFYCTLR